jgi:mono/diheme cytochrome c family protein
MKRLIWTLLPCLLASCEPAETKVENAVVVPTARLSDRASIEHGRALFRRYCALCHGLNADGKGVRREGLSADPRNFHDPVWREKTSPADIFRTISDGLSQSSMPSFRALTEEERWDIVAYLESLGREAASEEVESEK